MVWDVMIIIGQPNTVPAHLVHQVFPDNDDLLAAVLDSDKKNKHARIKVNFIFPQQKNCQNDTCSSQSCPQVLNKLIVFTLKQLDGYRRSFDKFSSILPAWVSGKHRKWHPLSELLCDVICQGRPEEGRFFYLHLFKPLNKML